LPPQSCPLGTFAVAVHDNSGCEMTGCRGHLSCNSDRSMCVLLPPRTDDERRVRRADERPLRQARTRTGKVFLECLTDEDVGRASGRLP
jgi:hypothetical protein